MKKSLLTVALSGALAIGFTGCMGGKELKPMTIQTNNTKSISLNAQYEDTISNKAVTLKEFKKGIEDSLDRDRKYRKLKFYNCDKNSYCQMVGREVEITDNMIDLYYLKGRGWSDRKNGKIVYRGILDINSQKNVRSLAHFQIPYSMSGDKDNFKLKAQFPTTFGNVEYGELGLANYPQLDTTDNMKADALRTFNNLNNITVPRSHTIYGEVNTKYDKKSIEANFERLVKRFSVVGFFAKDYINSISKKELNRLQLLNPYMIKYNNNLYPLSYKVYDYRGGSKVEYSLELRYKLNSDKTATLTQKDIANLKKEIEKIVND